MRRRHQRLLHTWGIAEGLGLSFASGASRVTVAEGVAVDGEGREIVLPEDTQTADLSGFSGKTVFVTIAYDEQETDATSETGVTGNTRWTETPLVEVERGPTRRPEPEPHPRAGVRGRGRRRSPVPTRVSTRTAAAPPAWSAATWRCAVSPSATRGSFRQAGHVCASVRLDAPTCRRTCG